MLVNPGGGWNPPSGKGDPQETSSSIPALAITKSIEEASIDAEHVLGPESPGHDTVAGIEGFGSNIAFVFAPWTAITCIPQIVTQQRSSTTLILSDFSGEVA